MTPDEFVAKWRAEADTMRRRGASVNGAALFGLLFKATVVSSVTSSGDLG